MNADSIQITKVSAHVETSGWGKVVLNSVISLPQRHLMLNQWQRSITRSVYNTGSCLEPPISLIMDLQCTSLVKIELRSSGIKATIRGNQCCSP